MTQTTVQAQGSDTSMGTYEALLHFGLWYALFIVRNKTRTIGASFTWYVSPVVLLETK